MNSQIKKSITILMACFFIMKGYAQDDQVRGTNRYKKSYIGLFGTYGNYQDTKFSNVLYNGYGGGLNLGTIRELDQYSCNLDFRASYNTLSSRLSNTIGDHVMAQLSFDFLYKITENYAFGGDWEMGNANGVNFSSLGNNSINIVFNSTLGIKGRYTRQIKEDLHIKFDLSIGLISVVKEGISFAYSASQQVLENGSFDFQNPQSTSVLSLSYYEFAPIFKLNNWKTRLSLDYKDRFELFYRWDLLNYSSVKNYPITFALHSLGVKLNYISKQKARK